MRLNQRGQNTLEYAVIIAAIVAALLLGQKYFKRGIQGKIREASDQIGEQFVPGETTGTIKTTSKYKTTEKVTLEGGKPTTKTETESLAPQIRTIDEQVAGYEVDKGIGE